MVYLGVDLHRKRSVVTTLAKDATVMLSHRMASRPMLPPAMLLLWARSVSS
jgi:hypothetical protein